LPSGSLGWGTIHVNALLVEGGYTVYVQDPERLSFARIEPTVDRAKFYVKAEKYAVGVKSGLWKNDATAKFARKLKALANSKAAK
jgi:hypothetical protein